MKKKEKRGISITAILFMIVAVFLFALAGLLFYEGKVLKQRTQSRTAQAVTEKTEAGHRESTEDSAASADSETDVESRADTERESAQSGEAEQALKITDQTGAEAENGGRDSDAGAAEEDAAETESGLAAAAGLAAPAELAEETGTEGSTEAGTETGTEGSTGAGTETGTEDSTEAETETESGQLVVAIDPGHQGSWVDMSDTEPVGPGASETKAKSSTGTEGVCSGLAEYELNLEVSLLLREELESRGYRVVLTRKDNDAAISNAERAQLAYEQGGDIYVRIHANGSEDASVKGALAMVPSSSNPYVGALAEDSYLLADCILSAYCAAAGFDSLGVQYYDNMTGINWSQIPVMILEMGFMTNESDDLRMADSGVQQQMAEGIANGIDAYFIKKGLKTAALPEQVPETVLDEDAENMNSILEALGEGYLYPAEDLGESWAVSVLSVNTGAKGDINGDVQMKSASVIKVFLMAAVYDRVLYPSSEERQIEITESYDGELRQLLYDMITVSDNTAANTLLAWLGGGDAASGMAVVNQFCQENGYTATSFGRQFLEENPSGDNFTSANDCRAILTDIYTGACVNSEASDEMLAYLRKQTRTGKIPAALSGTEATAANKTGELAGDYGDYVENDIAIVENEYNGLVYVLCVLSSDLQDNSQAVTRIQGISELVYTALRAQNAEEEGSTAETSLQ